jgi:DNA-binding protein HU-beta
MNKVELIDAIASYTGLTKKDSAKALNAVIMATSNTLVKGNKVSLVGFGTLEVHTHRAYQRHNHHTGQVVSIPAHKVAFFRAGSALHDAINQQA